MHYDASSLLYGTIFSINSINMYCVWICQTECKGTEGTVKQTKVAASFQICGRNDIWGSFGIFERHIKVNKGIYVR